MAAQRRIIANSQFFVLRNMSLGVRLASWYYSHGGENEDEGVWPERSTLSESSLERH